MIVEGYLGVNYDPVDVEVPSPLVSWNPQRSDPKTAIWKLVGWQQCMGNVFQNIANWLGQVDKNLNGLARMDTFSYYHGLEVWLKDTKNVQTGSWEIFASDFHVEYMNLILKASGSKYRLQKVGETHVKDVASYHDRYQRPGILGVRWTRSGHMINSLNSFYDNDRLYGLVVTDPYGHKPYQQRFGHNIVYTVKDYQGQIASFIMIVEVEV